MDPHTTTKINVLQIFWIEVGIGPKWTLILLLKLMYCKFFGLKLELHQNGPLILLLK